MSRKGITVLLAVTSPTAGQFSKHFQVEKQYKSYNKVGIKTSSRFEPVATLPRENVTPFRLSCQWSSYFSPSCILLTRIFYQVVSAYAVVSSKCSLLTHLFNALQLFLYYFSYSCQFLAFYIIMLANTICNVNCHVHAVTFVFRESIHRQEYLKFTGLVYNQYKRVSFSVYWKVTVANIPLFLVIFTYLLFSAFFYCMFLCMVHGAVELRHFVHITARYQLYS